MGQDPTGGENPSAAGTTPGTPPVSADSDASTEHEKPDEPKVEGNDGNGGGNGKDPVEGAFGDLALKIIGAVGTTAGVVTIVAGTGAAITWARLSAAELPGDYALTVLSQREMVAAGAMTLGLFVLLALVAVALVFAIDGKGKQSSEMRSGIIVIVAAQIAVVPWVIRAAPAGDVDRSPLALGIVATLCAVFAVVGPRLVWWRHRKRTSEPAAPTSLKDWFHATKDTQRPDNRDSARRPERFFAGLAAAIMALLAALLYSNDPVIVPAILLASALGAICFEIAHQSDDRFWPYGLAVFFAVLILGAAFSVKRIYDQDALAPVALVRVGPDGSASAVIGALVARDDDELWIGSVKCKGAGAVFSVPRGEVKGEVIGAPVGRADVNATARKHLTELLRRQPAAVRAKLRDATGAPVTDKDLTRYADELTPPPTEPCATDEPDTTANVPPDPRVRVLREKGDPARLLLDASASRDDRPFRYAWTVTAGDRTRRRTGAVLRLPLRARSTKTVVHLDVVDADGARAGTDVEVFAPLTYRQLFVTAKSNLSARGVRALERLAARLAGATRIAVVGHADARGDERFNDRLSRDRARAVVAFLRSREELRDAEMRWSHKGEMAPRTSNETVAGRQQNRRVEILAVR